MIHPRANGLGRALTWPLALLKRFPFNSARALTVILVMGYLAVVAAILAFRPAKALVAVTAETEILEVLQHGDARGQILLAPGFLSVGNGEASCVRGTFTPANGSTLLLTRQGGGDLVAEVRPATTAAGTLVSEDDATKSYNGPVILRFSQSEDCKAQEVIRIPVAGPATVGVDYSAQVHPDEHSLVMISGQIDTFARSLKLLPHLGGELYSAGATPLPAGARLRECSPLSKRVDWVGYAEARLGGGADGEGGRNLLLKAYTEAPRLALTTPGGAKAGGVFCDGGDRRTEREDVLGGSLLTRVATDPSIGILTALTGLAALWLQLLGLGKAPEQNPKRSRRSA